MVLFLWRNANVLLSSSRNLSVPDVDAHAHAHALIHADRVQLIVWVVRRDRRHHVHRRLRGMFLRVVQREDPGVTRRRSGGLGCRAEDELPTRSDRHHDDDDTEREHNDAEREHDPSRDQELNAGGESFLGAYSQ